MSTSTTRAAASTRSPRCGATRSCSSGASSATRIRRIRRPSRARGSWSAAAGASSSSSAPTRTSTRVVFTANASHALKLVGESYPFAPGDQFLLTFDNHNSVNGIREFDRARGARTLYLPMVPPELRVDEDVLDRCLEGATPGGHNLFAYPAQSNFSGVQHPLEWIAKAQAPGLGRPARRRGLRPHQPPRPRPLAPRLRGALVLQDVRLPHGRRRPHRSQGRRWPSSTAPGSPAGPSTSRRSRPTASSLRPGRRPSRTGRPTSPTYPRWSWGWSCSSRSASSGSTNACGCSRAG